MEQPTAASYTAPRPQRSIWATLGVVLAIVLAVTGLVVLGLFVAMYLILISVGSNK